MLVVDEKRDGAGFALGSEACELLLSAISKAGLH